VGIEVAVFVNDTYGPPFTMSHFLSSLYLSCDSFLEVDKVKSCLSMSLCCNEL
jgi:hypothetical protein